MKYLNLAPTKMESAFVHEFPPKDLFFMKSYVSISRRMGETFHS